MGRAALEDGAPEQSLGAGHGQQRGNAHRASRLAEHRDVAGIAAESSDVVAHPGQGGDLVKQADVRVFVAGIQEAVGADPVIDRHADDPVSCETAAVVPGRRPGAVELEHAARNPDHHRMAGRDRGRRPDIQRQAVLSTVRQLLEEQLDAGRVRRLKRLGPERERISHAAPGNRLRRTKTIGADRRRRVGDSFEDLHALVDPAAHFSLPCLDHYFHVCLGFSDQRARAVPSMFVRSAPSLRELRQMRGGRQANFRHVAARRRPGCRNVGGITRGTRVG